MNNKINDDHRSILTNWHVVGSNDQIKELLLDDNLIEALLNLLLLSPIEGIIDVGMEELWLDRVDQREQELSVVRSALLVVRQVL